MLSLPKKSDCQMLALTVDHDKEPLGPLQVSGDDVAPPIAYKVAMGTEPLQCSIWDVAQEGDICQDLGIDFKRRQISIKRVSD